MIGQLIWTPGDILTAFIVVLVLGYFLGAFLFLLIKGAVVETKKKLGK